MNREELRVIIGKLRKHFSVSEAEAAEMVEIRCVALLNADAVYTSLLTLPPAA